MKLTEKHQWIVVGVLGTLVVHAVFLLFLNFKTLPEPLAINEVTIDFSDEVIEEEQEEKNEDPGSQVDENGKPLTNVAADVNSKTQYTSKINEGQLSDEVDQMVKDLEQQYESEALRSEEAEKLLRENREKRNSDNSLFDEDAEDKEGVRGADEFRTTLKWSLDGRKNYDLPIPSYVCRTTGVVRVNIKVDRNGDVVGASIVESKTNTQNPCLRENALKYAKMARFNDDYSAPAGAKGWIQFTYSKQ